MAVEQLPGSEDRNERRADQGDRLSFSTAGSIQPPSRDGRGFGVRRADMTKLIKATRGKYSPSSRSIDLWRTPRCDSFGHRRVERLRFRSTCPDHQGPVSPYASPSVADDLSGLPSVFVSVMKFDPLPDEGLIYAIRLLEAGVSTEIHAYPGTFHGSSMVAIARVSLNNARDAEAALRKALRA